MRQSVRFLSILALSVGLVGGCGGDDDGGGGGGGNNNGNSSIMVKAGKWRISTVLPVVGNQTEERTFCGMIDIDSQLGGGAIPLDCQTTVSGLQINSSCAGMVSTTEPACGFSYSASGSGTVAADLRSFGFVANVLVTVTSGSAAQCGVGSQNVNVTVTGQWLEDDPLCGEGMIEVPAGAFLGMAVDGLVAEGMESR